MSIKMIAVDMDGTFLDDQMMYNEERFRELFQVMEKKKIHFTVASGNQYAQLKSFFPKIASKINFVAENGAYVVKEGETLFVESIDKESVAETLETLKVLPQISVIVCGKKSAYILNEVDEAFVQVIKKYYHQLTQVSSFDEVEDTILKFALSCPDLETDVLLEKLEKELPKEIVPVSSGHGSIDLIHKGTHKARGIQLLADQLGIEANQIMAFGDGYNDLEMLQHVKYGFAMANAPLEIRETVPLVASSNNEEGVLEVIESYFESGGIE